MTQDTRVRAHRRAALVADLIVAATVALLALVLLAPTSRATSGARQCLSTFAYGVPCGWTLPVTASVAAAVVSAVVLTVVHRRSRP